MITTPRVALVGRTNVGKSRLFNRLTESQRAIVTPIAGTTRDSNEARIEWRNRSFVLSDTGGWSVTETAAVDRAIRLRTETTVRVSDLALFIIDGRAELTSEDRAFARWLRKTRIKTILVVNKIENEGVLRQVPPDLMSLGFGEPIYVSAMSGRATGDLLDVVAERLPTKKINAELTPAGLKLTFVGRPNVGKSSLVNSILQNDRVLVSPEPFTTRDAIEIPFQWVGQDFILVDTAGLRRRVRIPHQSIEREGAHMTEVAVKLSDVIILVLDVSVPLSAQDRTIVSAIEKEGKCLVVAANKWDLIEDKNPTTIEHYRRELASRLTFIRWSAIVFVSAKENRRVTDLLTEAKAAAVNSARVISQPELDELLHAILRRHPPVRGKGTRYPKITSLCQVGTKQPHFQLSIGAKEDLHQSYLVFVERMIRERYDFRGCPIRLSIRKLLRRV